MVSQVYLKLQEQVVHRDQLVLTVQMVSQVYQNLQEQVGLLVLQDQLVLTELQD
jgi:hypothetical protein